MLEALLLSQKSCSKYLRGKFIPFECLFSKKGASEPCVEKNKRTTLNYRYFIRMSYKILYKY